MITTQKLKKKDESRHIVKKIGLIYQNNYIDVPPVYKLINIHKK